MNIFNHGYDDENGDYQVILKDHLGYRYEVLEFLG
jgi:dual specificity tyrosine-phosphorylation-regulated kinase 2/3/4